MSGATPRQELEALRKFLAEIERQFLSRHLGAPTLTPPSRAEILDVAAYAVLAHGALENFVEGISLWALNRVHANWQTKRRASRSLASLLLYRGEEIPDDEASRSVFDTIRLALDDAKSTYSRYLEQNNGVAMKHLRSLFRPLGIDVPEEPVLVASLEGLVSMRHQWAHQYRFGAKTVRTASDVRATVADCLALAKKLADQASKARP